MASDSHAFVSFALIGVGIFLVDSGIRGRKPLSTLADVVRNPSDIRGTLARHNSDISSVATPYNQPSSVGTPTGPYKPLGKGAIDLGNYTDPTSNGASPLVFVHDNYGHTIEVEQSVAPNFVKFLNDLQGEGYRIHDIGSYRPGSHIDGPNSPLDMHSQGRAIDINPSENPVVYNTPRGTPARTDLPANVLELATADGLTWGGDPRWSKKDPMHFSVPLPGYSY